MKLAPPPAPPPPPPEEDEGADEDDAAGAGAGTVSGETALASVAGAVVGSGLASDMVEISSSIDEWRVKSVVGEERSRRGKG